MKSTFLKVHIVCTTLLFGIFHFWCFWDLSIIYTYCWAIFYCILYNSTSWWTHLIFKYFVCFEIFTKKYSHVAYVMEKQGKLILLIHLIWCQTLFQYAINVKKNFFPCSILNPVCIFIADLILDHPIPSAQKPLVVKGIGLICLGSKLLSPT